MPDRRHIPALDGFRGVAILLVLGHHLMIHFEPTTTLDAVVRAVLRSGWIGVDLFFVLSGFLITGVLYEARTAHRRYLNFYARRMLRIFPAHYMFLAIVFFVLPHLPLTAGTQYATAPSGAAWYWCYATNFRIALGESWPRIYLVPLWSLAIEEQFYLVWPLLVFSFERRTMMRICLILAVFAFALRCVMVLAGVSWKAIYVLPLTRMDTLALGGWAALYLRDQHDSARLARIARWLIGAGCVALLLVLLRYGRFPQAARGTQTLGYTGLAVFATGVILLTVLSRPGGSLRRFLDLSLMRQAGRYSYTMYLINIPVFFWVARAGLDPERTPPLCSTHLLALLVFCIAGVATCVLCAFASWHLLEKRFLTLKRFFR